MDESEFRKLLEMFPVVRSRDYHAELDSSRQVNQSAQSEEEKDWQVARGAQDKRGKETSSSDSNVAFWEKLKLAAEKKMGSSADAERFCKAFQQVYKKLVYEDLTVEDAKAFMNSKPS